MKFEYLIINSKIWFSCKRKELLKWKIRIWKNEKKKKNMLEISLFYTCVPKTTTIWGLVLEIQTERDKIFYRFVPFFAFLSTKQHRKSKFWKKWKKHQEMSLCSKNHNHMMYASWDMECDRDSFLSFWAILDTCVPQMTIIWSIVPEISRAT